MVVWDISRSVGRELICGVMINIFKSTQRQLPNKNARKILFDNVTRCTFLVGWDLIHSIVVSYESLELHDEENCRYPYERLMPARGYFWLLTIVDKGSFPCSPWIHKPLSSKSTTMSFVFCPTTSIQAACYCDLSMDTRDHTFTVILDTLVGRFVISRKFAIHSGDLQLVHVTKSVFLASRVQSSLIHRGNRSLFVIVEGKLFSFVKPLWSSLALESVYSHIHLLPFLSSLHELHRGILKSEFDVVRLMNLEFVAASSAQKVIHGEDRTFQEDHMIGSEIIKLAEEDVSPEDLVFHKFYEETYDSDVEFGAGDESDNEEIENMLDDDAVEEEGGEYDYDDLDKVVGHDDDDDELVADASDAEMDTEMDMLDGEDVDDDYGGGDDLGGNKKKKEKLKRKSPFASLEEYEHLIDREEIDDSKSKRNVTAEPKKKKKKPKTLD
ncbi:hypothetical protein DY000_02024326 [Brassica cretica]|uniref:Uncharacterized protein n=1 Tax=Brassica cretica TaxID=69181 RepID=A0ABQ7EET8_BRACR|nr:hypothetical protein DY000_02024326 [Brassica cretica]